MRTKLLMLLLIIAAASCKKKEMDPMSPSAPIVKNTPADYHNLKPGNYWIYATYHIDSTGNSDSLNIGLDSCYAEKDTVINGMKYVKYINRSAYFNSSTINYLRDSGDYLVYHTGKIAFSANDFTNTLGFWYYQDPNIAPPEDTIAIVQSKMGSNDSSITIPAGTFKVKAFNVIFNMQPKFDYSGKIRSYNTYYSLHVGIVSQTVGWYIQIKDVWERRLVRYHVQ